MCNIAVDRDIPHAELLLGDLGELTVFDGRSVRPDDLRDVDILVVRTVTRADEELLAGSGVRFVGTASTGTDHIDFDALADRNITFASAHGANASAVADYIIAATLALAVDRRRPLTGLTAGVVGYGAVGSRVARRLPYLGIRVLVNDPPLEHAATLEGEDPGFVSLDDLLDEADIVTLHVPLEDRGPYPTVHLLNDPEFLRMGSEAWLLNSSRGGVVSESALARAPGFEDTLGAVLDVWENEPTIHVDLLNRVTFGTPHIAGYSREAKWRAVELIRHAILEFLGREERSTVAMPGSEDKLGLEIPRRVDSATKFLHRLAVQAFDIEAAYRSMQTRIENSSVRGSAFARLRKEFLSRRGFEAFEVNKSGIPPELRDAVEQGLQFRVVSP
jgi:erythronate-4-phosphate dehydrogenase